MNTEDIYSKYKITKSFLGGLFNLYLISHSLKSKNKVENILKNISVYKQINEIIIETNKLKIELTEANKQLSDACFLSKKYVSENKSKLKNNRRFVNSKQGSFDNNFAESSASLSSRCFDYSEIAKQVTNKIELLDLRKIKLKKISNL